MNCLKQQSILAILLIAILMGCNQHENPQEIKEKTAKATENAKRDIKAVTDGVREGWNSDRDKQVNLNTASKGQLQSLPGISSEDADRVIARRPYNEPGDLVAKRVLSRAEYDKIADRVTAN